MEEYDYDIWLLYYQVCFIGYKENIERVSIGAELGRNYLVNRIFNLCN